jgi:hypothetical protein
MDPSRGGGSPGSEAQSSVDALRDRGPKANTHQAKLLVLTDFLRDGFGRTLEELLPGIEKKVGSKIWAVKGSIDFLFLGSVIEIKTDFDREFEDGRSQLKKYFQCLWEASAENRYVGVVTDLSRWQVFAPVIGPAGLLELELVGSLDLRIAEGEYAFLWFDAIFFGGKSTVPTADDLLLRFGPGSPTYTVGLLDLARMWATARTDRASKLKLKLWSRAMEIVYGSSPAEEVFLAQTYLSLLVKLLVFLRLKNSPGFSPGDIDAALSGDYFVARGVTNLIEEDFFAWVLNPKLSSARGIFAQRFVRELTTYDLTKANEDLFKEIYQQIVATGQRHGTGEYYTPKWLCQRTLDVALLAHANQSPSYPRLLDPACGSGSFLTDAIHRAKAAASNQSPRDALAMVLSCVQGFDINPIAVTIARANYLLALGDLVKLGVEISIPVYVADSLKIPVTAPTIHGGIRAFKMDAEGTPLLLPESILADSERLALVLGAISEAIGHYRTGLKRKDSRALLERLVEPKCTTDEIEIIDETLQHLLTLVDAGSDSVWTFALRNMYAPVTLTENRVDVVLGNPPWIVMHSIEDSGYQDFLKSQVLAYDLLDSRQTKLYTHLEMAALFFRRAADLYLSDRGIVAFLMPVSVTTSAQQHQRFNRYDHPVTQILDMEVFRTTPNVFSLPPTLIVGRKGTPSTFPVKLREWSGSIASVPRNSDWAVVARVIKSKDVDYSPALTPTGASPYFNRFREGATLVPHNFWFIEPADPGSLGLNSRNPLVRTSADVRRVAKRPWKDFLLEGLVDSEFIYACYLGKDIIPFGTLAPRPVVLPLKMKSGQGEVLDARTLQRLGFPDTAKWLQTAQSLWEKHGTAKSGRNYPSIGSRLDYQKSLTSQDPAKRFLLVYNANGADICAVVLDRAHPPLLRLGPLYIPPAGIIADSTNFFLESASEDELHFLCAVMNAPGISKAVKPFQPRGLYGARHMGRRVFKLDIRQYDPSIVSHRRLSEISQECHQIVSGLTFSGPGFQTRRRETRASLSKELIELDRLVSSLRFDQPL